MYVSLKIHNFNRASLLCTHCPLASRLFGHQESNQSGISDNSTLYSSYISIPSIPGSLEFDTTDKFKEIQAKLEQLDNVSICVKSEMIYFFFFLKERDEKLKNNKVIGRVVEQTNNQGSYALINT